MRKPFYERLKTALTYFIAYAKDEEVVEFNKVLNEDQERVLELENELGEKDAQIAELKLHIESLEIELMTDENHI